MSGLTATTISAVIVTATAIVIPAEITVVIVTVIVTTIVRAWLAGRLLFGCRLDPVRRLVHPCSVVIFVPHGNKLEAVALGCEIPSIQVFIPVLHHIPIYIDPNFRLATGITLTSSPFLLFNF